MRGAKPVRRSAHLIAPCGVAQQSRNFFDQRARIRDAHRRPGVDRLRARLGEVERVRADQRRHAERDRLDQILAAERQQAAADERDVGRGVVREHLADRIAQHDGRIGVDRSVLAATDESHVAHAQQLCDRIEALRMARDDDRQRSARQCSCRMAGERVEDQRFFTFAR